MQTLNVLHMNQIYSSYLCFSPWGISSSNFSSKRCSIGDQGLLKVSECTLRLRDLPVSSFTDSSSSWGGVATGISEEVTSDSPSFGVSVIGEGRGLIDGRLTRVGFEAVLRGD